MLPATLEQMLDVAFNKGLGENQIKFNCI